VNNGLASFLLVFFNSESQFATALIFASTTALTGLISVMNSGCAASSSDNTRGRYPGRFATVPGSTNGRNPSFLSLFVRPSTPALWRNLFAYNRSSSNQQKSKVQPIKLPGKERERWLHDIHLSCGIHEGSLSLSPISDVCHHPSLHASESSGKSSEHPIHCRGGRQRQQLRRRWC